MFNCGKTNKYPCSTCKDKQYCNCCLIKNNLICPQSLFFASCKDASFFTPLTVPGPCINVSSVTNTSFPALIQTCQGTIQNIEFNPQTESFTVGANGANLIISSFIKKVIVSVLGASTFNSLSVTFQLSLSGGNIINIGTANSVSYVENQSSICIEDLGPFALAVNLEAGTNFVFQIQFTLTADSASIACDERFTAIYGATSFQILSA